MTTASVAAVIEAIKTRVSILTSMAALRQFVSPFIFFGELVFFNSPLITYIS
jgi:hypothetical protein